MMTFAEMRQYLLDGVAGKLHSNDRDQASWAREFNWVRCLLCGAESHASMRPPTAWKDVQLCACLQAKPVVTKIGYLEKLSGWTAAATANDGGIAWLKDQMNTDKVPPETVVYTNVCRCQATFAVTADMIKQAVLRQNLTHYQMARKCLSCKLAAEKKSPRVDLKAHGEKRKKKTSPDGAGAP